MVVGHKGILRDYQDYIVSHCLLSTSQFLVVAAYAVHGSRISGEILILYMSTDPNVLVAGTRIQMKSMQWNVVPERTMP